MDLINVPTIPVKAAKARVERFRKQMIDAQVADEKIPRAILIPIDDLMAIVRKYSRVGENGDIISDLQGVRAYFAVKATDKELLDDVTGLVVAVDKNGKDIIQVSEDGLGDPDDSEIYDFTKPCPDVCDTTSPLFVP